MRWLIGLLVALGLGTAPARASELVYRQFASPALAGVIPAMVYTPAGQPPAAGWPVLYLLHGHDGNEHSWVDLGNIQQTLDRMIGGREIAPVLVVMPGGGNSWYVDSEDVGGPGDFETAIVRDLAGAVERDYPVRTDRMGRAIAGLSMGGFGALRLALAHPDRFRSVASLSGAIWQNIPPENFQDTPEQLDLIQATDYFHRVDPDTVTVGRVLPSVATHFGGAFGVPFDPERFNRNNVFTLLQQQLDAKAALPSMYILCGDDDDFALWRGAFSFFETAVADKLPDVQLRIVDGTHAWTVWSQAIVGALKFIDERWREDS